MDGGWPFNDIDDEVSDEMVKAVYAVLDEVHDELVRRGLTEDDEDWFVKVHDLEEQLAEWKKADS